MQVTRRDFRLHGGDHATRTRAAKRVKEMRVDEGRNDALRLESVDDGIVPGPGPD